ncbi:MAG: glycosyltransferase family 4 protein [Candidatus Magasanikbacteria bacterium]
MNVLIFHQFYTTASESGISRFNIFAKYWKENGIDTSVITGPINYMTSERREERIGGIFKKEQKEGVNVYTAFSSSWKYETFFGRLLSYFSFMFSSFWAGLRAEKPQVVIASPPPIFIGLVAYIVSVFRGAPFILDVRDLWPDAAVELGFLENKVLIFLSRLLEDLLYRWAAVIVVNSPGFEDYISKNKKVPSNKIYKVPNPVIREDYQDLEAKKKKQQKIRKKTRQELGWTDKFVVLYSGAFSAVYDFDTILKAAENIKDEDVLFVLMGDGRQKEAVKEKVANKGLENVELRPSVPREEVAKFIVSADVGISILSNISILRYMYSTKVLDYMANSRPTILAMRGVTEQLICQKAQAGICIRYKDPEQLVDAINRLKNNPQQRREFGSNGQSFVTSEFGDEFLAKKYLDIIGETL